MPLIIVESPAKCSKIQGFLGLGYKVIASMGHIRGLVPDLESIGLTKNFEPTYEFSKEKAKAIAQLRDCAKQADSIILCADDDREGEAIAYSVAVLLKLNPLTNPRAVFREITKNAVCSAIQKPRTIDMNRVNSQQARAMLDMMVGFTISPLLWKHVGGGTALSAGRCQTPALRLVCEREQSIESFKSESSWALSGRFVATGQITGKNSIWPGTMVTSLENEESALNYLENHHNDPKGQVRSALTKPWTESPPQALMTSTLQQQCSNLYGCNPKRTMQIAQKLYEAGHITYMRTDQTNLGEEATLQAKKTVEARWGKQYMGELKAKVLPNKAKTQGASQPSGKPSIPVAQEAHEAIRPTHFELSQLTDSEDWAPTDRKIYHLIWLRAIQSIMAPAKGENRTVTIDLEGDEQEFPWEAKWKRTLFQGWKIADEKDSQICLAEDNDESQEESAEASWKLAEGIKEGQGISWKSLKAKPQESKPQGRFTEATLVRELEKKGIGRPSTFASLIATIVEKAYIETKDIPQTTKLSKTHSVNSLNQWPPTSEQIQLKQGGEKARIVPTPLGLTILEFTLKNFPDLFTFDFTAAMETKLDKIAEGSEPWKKVLEDTWKSYKDRYESLKKLSGGTSSSTNNSKRKEFSDGIVAIMTGKGPLLLKEDPAGNKDKTVFYGWPLGIQLQTLTEEDAKKFIEEKGKHMAGDSIGEHNGHEILRKKGPYGLYAECNGVRVNCLADTSLEDIIAKLQAKQESPARTLGPFQIRTGQYGPYLMKSGATGTNKKPVCVSIPKGTDIDTLTAQQAGELFEAGLKAKAAGGFKKFKKK
jgi:DNA topoisomerase-1